MEFPAELSIDLKNNHIKTISPETINHLKNISNLNLRGNPLDAQTKANLQSCMGKQVNSDR